MEDLKNLNILANPITMTKYLNKNSTFNSSASKNKKLKKEEVLPKVEDLNKNINDLISEIEK